MIQPNVPKMSSNPENDEEKKEENMEKREKVFNTFRKFESVRDEELFNKAIDFVFENKMTAAEVDQIFHDVRYSIDDLTTAVKKRVELRKVVDLCDHQSTV